MFVDRQLFFCIQADKYRKIEHKIKSTSTQVDRILVQDLPSCYMVTHDAGLDSLHVVYGLQINQESTRSQLLDKSFIDDLFRSSKHDAGQEVR